jgi:hypothetical protein
VKNKFREHWRTGNSGDDLKLSQKLSSHFSSALPHWKPILYNDLQSFPKSVLIGVYNRFIENMEDTYWCEAVTKPRLNRNRTVRLFRLLLP